MVSLVLDNLAEGLSAEAIVAEYPPLVLEDVRAAMAYAADLARAAPLRGAFRRTTYENEIQSHRHPNHRMLRGGIDLPHLKVTVSDHANNPFGIQWQRYWADAPYPELVKTVPHVAFEVDELEAALEGYKVLIPPNSPSPGVLVAMIEVKGAPVELMQIDRSIRTDL
jgi:hypothetical protein